MTTPTIAIVGASLAGAKAAEGARGAGFDGRIVLIGEEPGAPYERPQLSKELLRGEQEAEAAHVHPEGFYAEHAIELLHDRAVALDPDARTVVLTGGATVPFDAAVLATGAAPRHLTVPGADLAGVHHLRTITDAERLREAIRAAGRVAVIGAGWIGSEVAASARQMGAEVVLVDPAPTPLHRVLGDAVGAVFTALHADHGVHLRLGRGVTELRGAGTVEALVLDDGSVEPADVVVVGIGVRPRTEIAEAAGLEVDDGVVVDECLTTSRPGVFAAGDVARAFRPRLGTHLRVEHWATARDQGTTAGRNAAGRRDPYEHLPSFFSDQYDLGLEYVGHADGSDAVVVRGDLEGRKLIAWWHRDGLVRAAMAVNTWDVVDDLRAVIEARTPVDPSRLADPAVPLGDLVA